MAADIDSSQAASAGTNADGTTEGAEEMIAYPVLQEQKSFNVTRTISKKALVNTINIRDYFYYST